MPAEREMAAAAVTYLIVISTHSHDAVLAEGFEHHSVLQATIMDSRRCNVSSTA